MNAAGDPHYSNTSIRRYGQRNSLEWQPFSNYAKDRTSGSPIARRIVELVLLMFVSGIVPQLASDKSNGWLILEGGSNPLNPAIGQRFRELIGGADAEILLIPTAMEEGRLEDAIQFGGFDGYVAQLGIKRYRLLHTRDRNEANSEAFVAPIRKARGIWITGGRSARIAQAYLGTRVQHELEDFYERGGVIGGSSAGAEILGSFLLDGRAAADNFRGPAIGLPFLNNTAIEPHMNQAHDEANLSKTVLAHSGLLGIGLDTGTAIVVHGDSFEVIGGKDARVTIADGKPHEGKPFYFLNLGDRFNLARREIESR